MLGTQWDVQDQHHPFEAYFGGWVAADLGHMPRVLVNMKISWELLKTREVKAVDI